MGRYTFHSANACLNGPEARALDLWDQGMSKEQIRARTGIAWCVINTAISYASEEGSMAQRTNFITGSTNLLAALQREGMAL